MLILHALDQDSCITGTSFPMEIWWIKNMMKILSTKYTGVCNGEKESDSKMYGYWIDDNNSNSNDNVDQTENSIWMINMVMIEQRMQ